MGSIDSAGFSINPPLLICLKMISPIRLMPFLYQNVRAINFNTINRFSGYGQWSRKDKIGSSEVWYNASESIIGRLQADVSGSAQTTFSPRAICIKPDWEKIWSLGFQEVYTISHSTESLEMLQEWYSQM
jgi:hypothetical protein